MPNSDESSPIDCWEFKLRFVEILASDRPITEHPHYKACENCRDLARVYLHRIKNAVRRRMGGSDSWSEST